MELQFQYSLFFCGSLFFFWMSSILHNRLKNNVSFTVFITLSFICPSLILVLKSYLLLWIQLTLLFLKAQIVGAEDMWGVNCTQKTICVPDRTVTGIHINYYYCLFSSVSYFLFKRQYFIKGLLGVLLMVFWL